MFYGMKLIFLSLLYRLFIVTTVIGLNTFHDKHVRARYLHLSTGISYHPTTCKNFCDRDNNINENNLLKRLEGTRRKTFGKQLQFHIPSLSAYSNSQDLDTGGIKLVHNLNILFMRCSWISWWIQVILSVISGVILTFANTVRISGTSKSLWGSGFAFSTLGIGLSFFSTFWTWNITRLNRRIQQGKIEKVKVFPTLRRYSRLAIALSLCGMFITLLGAEQIVGTLASKVLMTQSFSVGVALSQTQNSLQALDIFLVQANTNVLLALFAPILCYSSLLTQVPISNSTTLN